ncbi:hypothetical protein EVAR_77784_1 [Eumeta japonica]|uniref:Uncharacterized protein n=1 Tax=Eumeta variegata TaxID=151549 RepID=A0A4C1TEE1_EUMVA|nr:hypothetical protein EVAR_77784_1 [Eumeta japonica]
MYRRACAPTAADRAAKYRLLLYFEVLRLIKSATKLFLGIDKNNENIEHREHWYDFLGLKVCEREFRWPLPLPSHTFLIITPFPSIGYPIPKQKRKRRTDDFSGIVSMGGVKTFLLNHNTLAAHINSSDLTSLRNRCGDRLADASLYIASPARLAGLCVTKAHK